MPEATIQKTAITIFDLDGCVSNDKWRRDQIPDVANSAHYDDYYSKCGQDETIPLGATLLRFHLKNNEFIAFLTARPFRFREITSQWIQDRFGIEPNKDFIVIMRTDDDPRSALEVKKDQLQHIINWSEQIGLKIVMAYDDKKEIAEHYALRGVPAARLGDHVCEHIPPAAPGTPEAHEQRQQYAAHVEPTEQPAPVIQHPTAQGLPVSDNRDPSTYNLSGAALRQNLPIDTWDFIAANGFTFMEGAAIELIAKWHTTKDIQHLKDAAGIITRIIANR